MFILFWRLWVSEQSFALLGAGRASSMCQGAGVSQHFTPAPSWFGSLKAELSPTGMNFSFCPPYARAHTVTLYSLPSISLQPEIASSLCPIALHKTKKILRVTKQWPCHMPREQSRPWLWEKLLISVWGDIACPELDQCQIKGGRRKGKEGVEAEFCTYWSNIWWARLCIRVNTFVSKPPSESSHSPQKLPP